MMTRYLLTSLALSLTLTACSSSKPSFGEKLEIRSAQATAIAKQWDKGQADVSKGEKMLKKGHNLVSEGQKDQKKGQHLIEQGQKLIDNGKRQMVDSEAAYQKMRSQPIPIPAKP